ncbi:MAG: rhodanese-like domain-containing protein [Thermoanaerobaculia bacterium]
MIDRRFFLELAALLAAAVLCASVANALATRERKLAWAGDYPNARVVPERAAAPEPVSGTEAAALTPSVLAVDAAPRPTATTTASEAQPQAKPAPPRYTLADFPATPDTPAVEIDAEKVQALYALKVPFIDARRTDVYRQGHIAGARSMPVWESDIDDRIMQFYSEGYPQERPIVVYCSGGACEDSHMLAQKLWGIGYNNVLVYTDGYPDWVKRGLPAARREQP